ncbi:MAG: LysR family transcriptional regulator [Bacillota bacterium]|nr:LysR family transcriptional regulator [Bacillota bacterium]
MSEQNGKKKDYLDLGNISFYKLKIFCKVAEKKSMTLAANEIFISQPAVSKHIKDLEEISGLKLFERKNGALLLTKAGNEFYYFAHKTLISYSEVSQTLKDISFGNDITINIAVAMSVSFHNLLNTFYKFREMHPLVNIILIVTSTSQIYDLILRNEVDIGITLFSEKLSKDIVTLEAWEEEMILVASPEYSVFNEGKMDVSTLYNYPFVCAIQGSPYSKLMDCKLKEIGLESYKCAGQINDINAMKRAVEAGFGLSLFFKNSVKNELVTRTLKQIAINHSALIGKFSLVYNANKSLNKIQLTLLDYVKSKFIID